MIDLEIKRTTLKNVLDIARSIQYKGNVSKVFPEGSGFILPFDPQSEKFLSDNGIKVETIHIYNGKYYTLILPTK